MREYELEALVVSLGHAREHAVKADMDLHFISDIDHLTVVARNNSEECAKEISNQ